MLTVTEINALPVKVVYDSPDGVWEGKTDWTAQGGFIEVWPATAKLKKAFSYNHSRPIILPMSRIWHVQKIQKDE